MSIEKIWGSLNEKQDEDLTSLLKVTKLAKLSSHSPLEKIKKNLLINIIWGIVICLFYPFIFYHFPIWQVQISIIIVLIFSVWALFTAIVQYRKMKPEISFNKPLLEEMKRHHESIKSWTETQQKVTLFIYPISATGGFLLGGASGSGKSVEEFMSKPFVIVALIIALVVLVPACYYVTRWMFKLSFGKHLTALKENIKILEEQE